MAELWSLLQRKIPVLFDGVEVYPSLLHGDLWSGNAGEDDSGPGIGLSQRCTELTLFLCLILYSRKYWGGKNFGELVICQRIADIKSAEFSFWVRFHRIATFRLR